MGGHHLEFSLQNEPPRGGESRSAADGNGGWEKKKPNKNHNKKNLKKKQSLSATICEGQPRLAGMVGSRGARVLVPLRFHTGAVGGSKTSGKVTFQWPFGNYVLMQKALVTLRKS